MKEIVSRINSFLVFNVVSNASQIRESFLQIHANYQEQFPHWSLLATRKKVISKFWFREVLLHFGSVIVLSCLLVLMLYRHWPFTLAAVFIAAIVSFAALLAFNYIPGFYNNFLPMLDTIIAEQEKNIATESETRKCKRTQFSIPTLTIIIYVFAKLSKISLPAANDRSAELLNQFTGSDKDKLKQNLSRLVKISHLSPKERAEMLKGIEVSRGFFKGLDAPAAKQYLDELEIKLQKTA